ncbi:flagellar basal-body MS-ring/collar protein FliF [Paradevosia shaoguanensis]|uniref:flagellar basal-body MS-ring/collar protein FliF n=1 Tax=Paradevosia shaoguanensis TaxID=1335043 RepID=UPI003C70E506
MDNLSQFLNRLGMARVAAMGVVAVLMLGFFAFLVMRASSPQLAPLYSGLSLEDSSAIVRELQTMGTPYELRGDGETIMIPRDQITTVRMNLAGNGLPARGQVGYEIFDQQNTLGATSFVQNINNVRALEGELARTISSLARIKSARVHLVLPERELFRRERKDPTASIVVSVRGELSNGEIRAIQHLVGSAIEGLNPNKVSIIDDSGRLLASGAVDGVDGLLTAEAQDRVVSLEERYRTRVEDMLANVLGAGRSRVQVSAELNLDRSTKTSERFDPDGQVVRSTQTRDNANSSNNGQTDAGVSVANELPGTTANGGTGTNSTEQQQATEETTNYEISKTTETAITEAGGIKKLSVAVVVDGRYSTDTTGNSVYAPRDQTEIDQIKSLVRSAIGFDEARGDQVEVVNMQFAERPEAQGPGTDGPGLFDFTRDDLINWAQMGVTLIISLALVFFVMRPLVKRVLAPEDRAPLALPPSAEVEAGLPAVPDLPEEANPPTAAPWVNGAKAMGEAQLETLKSVGQLVDENPKQAALIVRDWLSSNSAAA